MEKLRLWVADSVSNHHDLPKAVRKEKNVVAAEILHFLSFTVQAVHSRMGIKLASRGGLPSNHTFGALLTSSFLSNALFCGTA